MGNMKRALLFLLSSWVVLSAMASAKGLPLYVNYTSNDYQAHNRNFDIVCDSLGRVYVANFEGLLYYDRATWKVLHTPGISRVTTLCPDSTGRIWVGGYSVLGYLYADATGHLQLQTLATAARQLRMEEVSRLSVSAGVLRVHTASGKRFSLQGDSLYPEKAVSLASSVAPSVSPSSAPGSEYKINHQITLPNGMELSATAGKGLIARSADGMPLFSLDEENGLCNNNVNHLAYDGMGGVWGATDNGIFCLHLPGPLTQYTHSEGLRGEVTAICPVGTDWYVGTLQGLFRRAGNRFVSVPGVSQSCWQLVKVDAARCYAATAAGLFAIHQGKITRLQPHHTLSVLPLPDGSYYTGELTGVYHHSASGQRRHVGQLEKVARLLRSTDGVLWAQTVYGEVFRYDAERRSFVAVAAELGLSSEVLLSLFLAEERIYVLSQQQLYRWDVGQHTFVADRKVALPAHPMLLEADDFGRLWYTNSEGSEVAAVTPAAEAERFRSVLHQVRQRKVRALAVTSNEILLGGDEGLLCWQVDAVSVGWDRRPEVFIRSIQRDHQVGLWGGFGREGLSSARLPFNRIGLDSDSRVLEITFSSAYDLFDGSEYRYRLQGYSDWSDWSPQSSARFENLWYGSYTFEVQVRDQLGRVSPSVSVDIVKAYPLYLKWYSLAAYVLLFFLLVALAIRVRMMRLLKEKLRLERIVEERTSQLRQQKDEIEEKSKNLELALEQLGKAQQDLIQQEKMATVGKLTKGLIDRILNPLNYINNFAHLTIGLSKELTANIEEAKDQMDEEIYEDTVDILDMVQSNLQKIEEHGVNTTRILKAMEELLKNRNGHMQMLDLASLCRKIFEMLNAYFEADIRQYGIETVLEEKYDFIALEGNAELLSKCLLGMLGNSMYAVKKQYALAPYHPQVRLSVEICEGKQIRIVIYDNGIGIEEGIVDNIFDPFFTTKTTAEAAGVGLYLSREIILNHGGSITVHSVKNVFTEFEILLPVQQEKQTSNLHEKDN